MEWTELILEHIVQIIRYMAWPAVVLIILLLFRKELGLLAGRLEAYEGEHGKLRFSTISKQPSWKLEEEAVIPEDLSKEAKKILATLWERQIYHFQDDYSKRWSFRILPNARSFGIFTIGFAELLKADLVTWTPKDGQALLSDRGIDYIKGHPEISNADADDRYTF